MEFSASNVIVIQEIEDHVIETAVADAGYEVTGIK